MIFNTPLSEIVNKRISVRTYENKKLDIELRKKLENYLATLDSPFNNEIRYMLVDKADNEEMKLGTYGVIRGANTYVITALKRGEMDLEQLGYELEKFILYATSLGLGTCWLGGTFKKSEFAKAINLKADEIMPIVTPVGYSKDKTNVLDLVIRKIAKPEQRKNFSELFFDGNFENLLAEKESDIYTFALNMVRRAPSASNKQPWRILKEGDTFHFYLQHAKGYVDKMGYDIQRVDIGIAMCHFDLSMKEQGIEGKFIKLSPDIKVPDQSIEYIISWAKVR
ncbi:nitroreductase [Fervidicella metallireducens AeB]|uniref:Nitroreductase n=1 Tax=Fervidicella metallireducens AeB TaxID=1403537 RepID=A0A017RST8_9CLOT|nr:nitroreductase family protein [Fervidicella metallireducens]EYE87661.1 nitroreductase [Fervidicella metallireducens AeB]